MPRKQRLVIPGLPHHVTQRGNRKEDIFFTPEDRYFFLSKLQKYAAKSELEIVYYCLMSNHTHLVVVPKHASSMGQSFRLLHMHYSQYLNSKQDTVGRNWQGRYFSSPMDEAYTFRAIQYAALNPVRARMVEDFSDYEWSSSRALLDGAFDPAINPSQKWREIAVNALCEIRNGLNSRNDKVDEFIRRSTSQNLPSGSEAFIDELEVGSGRELRYRGRGRPRKGKRPY